MLHEPTKLLKFLHSLKAFIDNVVLHATASQQDTLNKIGSRAQQQLNWWLQLVQVTKLNPKKCCSMIYQWIPDKRGILQLHQPQVPADFISLHTNATALLIPINNNSEGTRYLGLYITINRNTKPMEQHIWKKQSFTPWHFTTQPCPREKLESSTDPSFSHPSHTHSWKLGSLQCFSTKFTSSQCQQS